MRCWPNHLLSVFCSFLLDYHMRNYQCAFLHIITIANKRSTVFGFKSRVRWWRRVLFSFAVCDFVLSWLNCVDFFRTLSLPLPPSRFFSMIFWLYWVTVLFDRTQIRARALQHRWTISNQNNSINAQTISVDRFYNRHLLINLRFLLHYFFALHSAQSFYADLQACTFSI